LELLKHPLKSTSQEQLVEERLVLIPEENHPPISELTGLEPV
jgi:hypothetical protein